MNSTMRVVLGIGVVIVAVVLLIVLKKGGDEGSSGGGATTAGKPGEAAPITTIVVDQNGKPVGGIAEISLNEGEEARFKVESAVADEVHMHGYDIAKDVIGGRHRELRLPGDARRRLRGRAREPQGTDPGATGQPVEEARR